MQNDNIPIDEYGYVTMHRIHKYPPKNEDGAYIIDSRKNNNQQKNYLLNEKRETVVGFDDNLLFPELLEEEKVTKPKNKKHKDKKSKKREKANRFTGIQKASQNIRKIPFHPDKKINNIIIRRIDNIKIKSELSNDIYWVDIISKLYGEYILYNMNENQYYWYTGKFWSADNGYVVYNFIVKIIYEINRIIKKNSSDNKFSKQSNLYCNHCFIKNILEMLKTRCVCHSEDFDKCPYLLNVQNGTVNLKTKELQEHNPEDMITKFIDVDYNREVSSVRFADFVLEICDDGEDLAKYLQIMYGYALTGETGEQCIFIEKGYGSNGKSTLNEVISIVVVDYTDRVDFTLFQRKQYASANSPTPELAKLKGKHIVFCSETDDNQLNEAKIKEITGGTRITARALHKAPFTYIPEFTIIFDGNNLPTIKGIDHGIWRRIVVIPFNRRFNKDVTLKDTLLEEKEFILKWLIDGAYKYYKKGLPKCKAVEKATERYREEENTVESFLKHAVLTDSDSKYPASTLYSAYSQYCTKCCSSPVNNKLFKAALTMKGYKSKRTNKGMVWLGICPKNDIDEQEVQNNGENK